MGFIIAFPSVYVLHYPYLSLSTVLLMSPALLWLVTTPLLLSWHKYSYSNILSPLSLRFLFHSRWLSRFMASRHSYKYTYLHIISNPTPHMRENISYLSFEINNLGTEGLLSNQMVVLVWNLFLPPTLGGWQPPVTTAPRGFGLFWSPQDLKTQPNTHAHMHTCTFNNP